MTEINRQFYNEVWTHSHLECPERLNTWPLISGLLPAAKKRLEVGPGLRPRLPIVGTHFVEISDPAIDQLNACGGMAQFSEISNLPFEDGYFDLICAFDVMEHANNDLAAFAELSRLLKAGGKLVISVPLHAHLWSRFDDWAGHARRYAANDLRAILAANHFRTVQSAAYGMQQTNAGALKFGNWCQRQKEIEAMTIFNRVMHMSANFQKKLEINNGFMETDHINEILMVCQRGARAEGQVNRASCREGMA